MNRKLLNGFLVVALAIGGVGTFTSCKDENSGINNTLDNKSLQAQIDAIRNVSDQVFYNKLKALVDSWCESCTCGSGGGEDCKCDADTWLEWANKWTNDYQEGWTYQMVVDATQAMKTVYDAIISGDPDQYAAAQQYVEGLYQFMFDNIIQDTSWYKQILANSVLTNNLAKRANSISLNQTYNPVFGSINLPIGLKTTVLAAYKVGGVKANGYAFPTQVRRNDAVVDWKSLGMSEMEVALTLSTIEKLNPLNVVNVSEGNYTSAEGTYGQMGAAYVTINPTGIDFTNDAYSYSIINSRGETVFSNDDLDVMVNEDLLSFGYTSTESRSTVTGLYKVKVNVPDNLTPFVDFDDAQEFLMDVKAAFEDKTISNVAYIGEQLYKRLNNALPAYAVKVEWEENGLDETTGEYTNNLKNSVISNFDLAAATVHPLSYGLDIEAVLGPQLSTVAEKIPTFSPLEDYLTKIQNKLKINFTPMVGVDNIKEIQLAVILENGNVYLVTENGVKGEAVGTYDSNVITTNPVELQKFVNSILKAAGIELTNEINSQVVAQLNSSIDNINKQMKNYLAKVENINSYIDRIKNSSKLDYADKLIDIYNKFAEKAKQVLSNPNHYLQVAALYSNGDGHYHRLSSDPYSPTPVKIEDVDSAIELLLASYTGDVVIPSYQKYVAVTKVGDNAASSDDNKGYNINTVIPGQQHRAALQVGNFKDGDVLTVSYLSVDYHGMVSMQNYYVQIVK